MLARDAADFSAPPPMAGAPADVHCERGAERRPICFEVELPETLVRRATVARLRALAKTGIEPRVVLVSASERHERDIAEARRLLQRAGLPMRASCGSSRKEGRSSCRMMAAPGTSVPCSALRSSVLRSSVRACGVSSRR